ncbi:uncharacterized protein EV420DRAFT_1483242 [Desarmillaria tabescens]|uniref:Uncharacterized protein n=1 Tax=Armillaria tabescens TaxID=1929756 RepID=A0AA39MX40_ARMTA|nr:uncharacterized protein EV420DRAFT_1483242 [Desarmillaria tabescens]KAK0449045.1 hypothetical protein EV420DRAFT_1483242 [Desarmillaria tabescens]
MARFELVNGSHFEATASGKEPHRSFPLGLIWHSTARPTFHWVSRLSAESLLVMSSPRYAVIQARLLATIVPQKGNSCCGKIGLANNNADGIVIERVISRADLLEVAPDREDALISHATTEELRETLELRSTSPHARSLHIYQSHDSSMKLPKASVRTSVFLNAGPSVSDTSGTSLTENYRRRVLSADTGPTNVLKDIRNRLVTDIKGNVTLCDPWNLRLSTQDKLISPRPLGPTHILVIVDASEVSETTSQKRTVRARSIEMPINDLLFKLNMPNLSNEPKLPPRMHQELPRVGIRVPHIETFLILVIFLHTRNRIELMRSVLPEWIRDILRQRLTGSRPAVPAPVELKEKKRGKIFGILSLGSLSTESVTLSAPAESGSERLFNEVAKEIAEASRDGEAFGHDLVGATTTLNALRDNLTFIGFYEKALWAELEDYSNVLARAITLTSESKENPQSALVIAGLDEKI